VPRAPALRLPGALAVLREREFRLLYAGQTVSLLGDGILNVALAFAVLDLTGSVSDLGFVLAVSKVPVVLTILAGGVIADRLPRRAVMVVADLVRMGCLGATGLLLVSGDATLWELLVLQAGAGTAAGFFYPASTGLVPLTVPASMLQQANALRGLSESLGRIVGPAIAGILVVAAGSGWALTVDAVTFGVSATSLVLLRLPAHVPPLPQRFLLDLADGWREFRSRTWVWATVIFAGSLGNLFTAALPVLGPQIARQHLGGAGAWAAISAAQGVGGLFAGLIVLGVRVRRPLVAANIGWGLLVVPNLLLGLVAPWPIVAVGMLAGGAGLAVGQALWDTALQRHVPAEALSRVSSYDWFGSLVLNPVGFALVGPIAGAVGARATLIGAACWFAVSSVCLASLPAIRALRDD
jgi:MFS family permease